MLQKSPGKSTALTVGTEASFAGFLKEGNIETGL